MKYIDEFQDREATLRLADAIRSAVTKRWSIMEVCGGQTHAIMKFGLDQLLPDEVHLIHGPGCPVCVTPVGLIDHAIAIARKPEAILCSFGDMMRVPGTETDLLQVKARGGDVRMVYSPVDAVTIAEKNPEKEVVFFGVGFETTAPANAMSVLTAQARGVKNFSLLVSQVLVIPAMKAILSSPDNRVQGFLAAGHVCTVTGWTEYEPVAAEYGVPMVVTGFEPTDILRGVLQCVRLLEAGKGGVVENAYERVVKREGNPAAWGVVNKAFQVIDRDWRGIGVIPQSGLDLRPEFDAFNATVKFDMGPAPVDDPGECISGIILQGLKKPDECPCFGTTCTPETPLGATMVSNEGACSAYYLYRQAGGE